MNRKPSTMRALHASPDATLREIIAPRPIVTDGHVLVRIKASGVNPLDLKIRGQSAPHAKHPLPAILGIDLAGTIEDVAPDVHTFRVGDEVFGMTGGVGGLQGSLAEFAAVDARLLAIKPASLDMRTAAALPLAFVTAWEGLVDRARISAGMTVLVQGGAGGVGHIAVQLASALGARVFATGTRAQHSLIEALGAVPIDYESAAVADYVAIHTERQGFDVVFDTVGGGVLDDSFRSIKRFGHVVSALGWGTHALAPLSFQAGTYSGVFTLLPLLTGVGREHHGEILREAALLASAGKVVPLVDPQRFTLTTVDDAHRVVAAGRGRVKIVVDVNE
jgi:NADPH:quinone reductase-like Zn-dependent oxidoreductase